MKLLFDQNLSHRLPRRLADLYPGSEHVRTAGLDQSLDVLIWHDAKEHNFCIVTQDADFAEHSHLYGAPPKVIWLRCSNTQPREIERMLRQSTNILAELERNAALHIIELLP